MSAAEIDAYLAGLTPKRAGRVGAVVALLRRTHPDLAETIEYKMPIFRKGEAYFGVADRAQYVSLYLGCVPGLCAEVLASDPRLKGGKGCVNVTDSREMPLAALERALAKLFA